jgi:hypothetical protein
VLCALDRKADATAMMAELSDPEAFEAARSFCQKAQNYRDAARACEAGQEDRAGALFEGVYHLKLSGAEVCKGLRRPHQHRWIR